MTQIEAKIRDVLNRYCDLNGGGPREAILTPGSFGGFDVTLIWDGFSRIGRGDRHAGLVDMLIKEIGSGVFQTVRTLHVATYAEKVEEDAIAAAIPSDLPWLR